MEVACRAPHALQGGMGKEAAQQMLAMVIVQLDDTVILLQQRKSAQVITPICCAYLHDVTLAGQCQAGKYAGPETGATTPLCAGECPAGRYSKAGSSRCTAYVFWLLSVIVLFIPPCQDVDLGSTTRS